MKLYKCDRCGEVLNRAYSVCVKKGPWDEKTYRELCKKCFKDMIKWIDEGIE